MYSYGPGFYLYGYQMKGSRTFIDVLMIVLDGAMGSHCTSLQHIVVEVIYVGV